ncbi:MAG: uroporphyrinogen-III synthase [Chloroflexi bacterium]|nr:MAG: uroporphyrinogen-III synthase [Chloroflexota bacterium]
MSKPRVVVTRTADQAPVFCQKLAAAGFTPIAFPAIQLEPLPTALLEAALQKIHTFDWLVFTSGNAVDFFFKQSTINNQQSTINNFPKIAATGSATAQKLNVLGITVNFIPDKFVGEELVAGLGNLTNQNVLLPRAKRGRPEIVKLLREAGAEVTEVALYDTITAVPTPTALAQLAQGFKAITFTSPSSVRNFLKIIDSRPDRFQKPVRSLLQTTVITCIGPITATAARDLGLTVTLMPTQYTIDSMVQELKTHFPTVGQDAVLTGQNSVLPYEKRNPGD